MSETRRYHPLLILFQIVKLIRSSIVFIVYLFVLKAGSDADYVFYGRIVFLAIFILTFLSIIFRWFVQTYQVDERAFHLNKGLFVKSKQTVPFTKIQNINRHTSFFHRLFQVTSIHFETGMNNEESSVDFPVITQAEADRLEAQVKQFDTNVDQEGEEQVLENQEPSLHKTIHFTPTKKDTFKAAFSSLSFLVFVPLLISVYTNIDDIFDLDKQAEGLFYIIIHSWWITTIVVFIIIVSSLAYGIIRTYIKYGKYEISSDSDRIYIKKGILDETAFSISKEKVQAVEVSQSFMKRILGLAEVKLTSTSNSINDKLEVNTLYPFLPIHRAYGIISDILPSYNIVEEMERLPKQSLWIRLMRPSWFWIIVVIVLFFWKPAFLGLDGFWWMGSILLFVVIYLSRVLDYFHTRYVLRGPFIQMKTGSFSTTLFMTKRDKVIGVTVSRGPVQRKLRLASILTKNRANPIRYSGLDDVPQSIANDFYYWYADRRKDINIEE
ncbi:PH domain-containing protein [Radiobacillus deserti]|uniref:PH domain-containing protein n=1 Tax=Radiobacillus deserti TaxID=2594883 RepID=A0A516KEW5_9BACI|nr:PH domain-containing protein [Radiobacillus deserti]QDP39920.1 PH domain-containing protein [Radiobacillus deserti]